MILDKVYLAKPLYTTGQQNINTVEFDYFWITNEPLTSEILQAIDTDRDVEEPTNNSLRFKPSWELLDTIFLADFENSDSTLNALLNAGNLNEAEVVIEEWKVYKKALIDNEWQGAWNFVATMPAASREMYDLNVSNNYFYKYRIFPVMLYGTAPNTKERIGLPYVDTDAIQMESWNVCLFDIIPTSTKDLYYIDESNFWQFELDIKLGSMTQNLEKAVYNSLSKYPKTSGGIKNYYSGDLSCYLSDVIAIEQKLDTAEKQERFKEFINSGKLKILKERKGHVLLVDTMSNSFDTNYDINDLPVTISCSWVQIGDTSGMTIIYEP